MEALRDSGGIDQVASTQAARDVLVDGPDLHHALRRGERKRRRLNVATVQNT